MVAWMSPTQFYSISITKPDRRCMFLVFPRWKPDTCLNTTFKKCWNCTVAGVNFINGRSSELLYHDCWPSFITFSPLSIGQYIGQQFLAMASRLLVSNNAWVTQSWKLLANHSMVSVSWFLSWQCLNDHIQFLLRKD